jgi:hypothetical protein
MKREDEKLLLKDLCARLPYGVKCLVNYTFCNETTDYKDVKASEVDTIIMINQQTESYFFEQLSEWFDVDDFKPYLFPLSSMTEEQKEFIKNKFCYDWDIDDHPNSVWANCIEIGNVDELIDWFLENHFDYRGLIPMGLANDATNLNIY